MALTAEELKRAAPKTCKRCKRMSKTQIQDDGMCDTCNGIRPHRKDHKKKKKKKKEK